MKAPTMKQVAQMAGVSSSTVSRVINHSAPVNEDLQKKVMKAVEALGYSPDQIARSLRKGKTNVVGVIIPNITNPFFPVIVKGAEDYLRKQNYLIMLGNSDFDLKMEKKLFNTLKAKNVDGLLFVGSGGRTPFIDNLENRKKIVFVDRIYENIEKNYVIVDNIKGMNDLVNYLLDLNHKSFVMINGKKRTYTAEKRREGFELALKNANISQYEIIYSGYSYEKGYETALSLKEIPDAVVCGNDMIAFGVIDALKKRGINVPEDVSVTGFDDLTFSSKFSPPLTTMHQPIYELGFEAAKLLVKIINDKQIKKNKIILPTTLVPRKTTALRLKKTS